MFPSTSFTTTLPQEITTNLHYSRRLLLNSPPTPQAPTPTYQVLDPNPTHVHTGFDANIVMILAVLVSALICSLCINTLIRCVIKCSSVLRGEPNYYLNMVSDPNAKTKVGGVDKRALKTFTVVKYSKDVEIQGLGSECVICLNDFKGGEKVRILPKCHHGFHTKCIDKWLSSNTSCPTCRQSLVETCHKIIGCGDDHQAPSSSSSSSSSSLSSSSSTTATTTTTASLTTTATTTTSSTTTSSSSSTEEMIVVSVVPLQREDLMRNYRGDQVADQS